ncbi:hypothetical protein [Vannielia litorea]|uniref:Uncharacterized protein n=1 Tax=Vannielia litorea TaxID=1217970 RepID=A0A1N6ESG2_9RHOB|nr:hypothetical protein [Vannielia litorea]SIN85937.1 hypothetical protein SAMN05444002_1057 [Vannielia litorea]
MPVFVTFAALAIAAAMIVARPLWALTVLVVLMLASALLMAAFEVRPDWAAGLIAQSAAAGPLALVPLACGVALGLLIRRREARRG